MFKNNIFLNYKDKNKLKLIHPVEVNKTTNQRNEQSEFIAIYETKTKPAPKIHKESEVLDKTKKKRSKY